MAQLPFQDALVVPIQWSGAVAKTTMTTGSYALSGTIGLHPWRETAVLTWVLRPTDVPTLMSMLKADKFNATYDYNCTIFGAVRIRPTDAYGFGERRSGQWVTVTVNFERVSA